MATASGRSPASWSNRRSLPATSRTRPRIVRRRRRGAAGWRSPTSRSGRRPVGYLPGRGGGGSSSRASDGTKRSTWRIRRSCTWRDSPPRHGQALRHVRPPRAAVEADDLGAAQRAFDRATTPGSRRRARPGSSRPSAASFSGRQPAAPAVRCPSVARPGRRCTDDRFLVRLAHALARRDRIIIHSSSQASWQSWPARSRSRPRTRRSCRRRELPWPRSACHTEYGAVPHRRPDAVDGTTARARRRAPLPSSSVYPRPRAGSSSASPGGSLDRDDGRRPGGLNVFRWRAIYRRPFKPQLRRDGVAQRSWAA